MVGTKDRPRAANCRGPQPRRLLMPRIMNLIHVNPTTNLLSLSSISIDFPSKFTLTVYRFGFCQEIVHLDSQRVRSPLTVRDSALTQELFTSSYVTHRLCRTVGRVVGLFHVNVTALTYTKFPFIETTLWQHDRREERKMFERFSCLFKLSLHLRRRSIVTGFCIQMLT